MSHPEAGESTGKHTNRLIREKSPYLLQHAHNPVDWYPWGDEAFDKARSEDKPIFLSIGYSTCHWCHVMERESFEDPEVAALLNEAFVSIKVDREERPDIDSVYMTVCQMMTGSGGWPLTILMTPDKKPFFSATYIPKSVRFGRAGMVELIPRVREIWRDRRDEVLRSGNRIVDVLSTIDKRTGEQELDASTLDEAQQRLAQRFDDTYGGFSGAPKFPTPHNLTFLLRHWKRTGDEASKAMVLQTLEAMRRGGVFDHVGFGFHRYSTDERWLVPHFEKMLYDQALMVIALVEAHQVSEEPLLAEAAREVVEYVRRDLRSPEGAFFSAEDADSEGVEGKFYVWSLDELSEVLTPDELRICRVTFGVTEAGNFHDEATSQKTGANILHLPEPLGRAAEKLNLDEATLRAHVEEIRSKLFTRRAERIRPSLDDKVVTDWNGLMIAALALASAALREPTYLDAAREATHFILERMRDDQGRLLHRYRDGDASVPGFLEDYAYLTWGLLELYEASFETRYLRLAIEMTDQLLERFWDKDLGGFFQSAHDAELVLVRRKEAYDGATPSGNSVAALNLIRLARLTGSTEYEERAAELVRAFSGQVAQAPEVHTLMLQALDLAIGPTWELVIAGPEDGDDTRALIDLVRGHYLPRKVVLLRPEGGEAAELIRLAPFVEPMKTDQGRAQAYLCHDHACDLPTTDADQLLEQLGVSAQD